MNLRLSAVAIRAALEPIHPISDETVGRFAVWTDTLNTWSRAQRLVGWRTSSELLTKGLVDMWMARSVLVGASFDSLVDVGSGSGLPGLLLAADMPEVQVHLVESRRKRAAFLREAARAMGLARVRVHHGRAADVRGTLDPDRDPDRDPDPDPDRLLFVSRAFAAPSEALAEAARWGARLALVSTSLARVNADECWPPAGWRQLHGNFRRATAVDLHELLESADS